MPEHERDTGHIALLEAYERALANDLAVSPPDGLDPELALLARRLERQLGGTVADPATTPDPAFRAALRRRLEEQAARYPAVPARSAPLTNGRYAAGVADMVVRPQRRASFGPRDVAPTAPAPSGGSDGAPQAAARPSPVPGTAPRRPFHAAISTGLGWLSAALVFLIVLLATALLLRGLPRSTPAARPTTAPTVTIAPAAVPDAGLLAALRELQPRLNFPLAIPADTRGFRAGILPDTSPPDAPVVTIGLSLPTGQRGGVVFAQTTTSFGSVPPLENAAPLTTLLIHGQIATVEVGRSASGDSQVLRFRWQVDGVSFLLQGVDLPRERLLEIAYSITPLAVFPVALPTATRVGATGTPLATPATSAPLWQATGALAQPRAQHSATRLADGRVLVAGGYSDNDAGATAEAELYDPRTGRWAATGAMGAARVGHAALLLPDGTVLVAGGFNNSVAHNTTSVTGAERYDPATGRWRPTSAPPVTLGLVAMDLLADGRALVVASSPVGTPPEAQAMTALLYDSATDRWSSLGAMALEGLPTVVALADGRALLLGAAGQVNDGTTPALLLDPATGAITPAPLPDARGGFSATRLPDGAVLVAGGTGWTARSGGQTTILDTTLRFDAANGRWSPGPSLAFPRTGQSAVVLTDGRVLLVGGDNPTGASRQTTAEFYNPQTNRWNTAGTLTSAVRARFAVAPLADGRALVIGGDAGFVRSEWLASVELFTPPARSVAPTGPQPTPTLAVRPATPTAAGMGDWSSPSAGLLFFGGRGYHRALPPLPDGSAPQAGAQVGATLLRWQSGGVFPAGMPIYAVAGQPAEEWLAIRDGDQLILYQRDGDPTALLAGVQVVVGTVASDGELVCPGYGCPAAPPKAQPGTVATANRVRIERALQGSLPAGSEIAVRQMGVSGGEGNADRIATLRPGERVILFLIPAQRQSIGDFSGGDYYWTTLGWLYGFVGDAVVPLGGSGGVQTPLDRFEAAVREIFAAVTPRAPTDPVPTPRPVPTATGVVPTALPIPTATPTPTLGP